MPELYYMDYNIVANYETQVNLNTFVFILSFPPETILMVKSSV